MNINNSQEEEIEKLTRTLKNSKLATSESEARRMAEEMLGISKKVASDFAEREKKIYGEQKQSRDVEVAHKQMEQLAANMAQGKSNVRLDLDEIDVNKPLRDLVKQESEPVENDEDDAVEIPDAESAEEDAVEKTETANESAPEDAEPKKSEESVESDDDNFDDDDGSDDDKEPEEKAEEAEPSTEASEGSSEDDFSVKELDTPPANPESRRKEIDGMEESKIDLSSMFNANK
jgi:hypothetical protein